MDGGVSGVFELGDVALQSGGVLRDARLAYRTYGDLNESRSNAVVFPTFFAGVEADNAWLIGEGRALDPRRYFIVIPNMFGNGLSTSPSQYDGDFPLATVRDNVRQQHRLLTDELGVARIELAVGWSMGGQQAYHWAAMYPDMVKRVAPICSSARTSIHNRIFLDGLAAALRADPLLGAGGMRGFARVYAGWLFSQAWWREGLFTAMGAPSPEDVLTQLEAGFATKDARNLLAMIDTWRNADIAGDDAFAGDLAQALGAISARALIMPCRTDLYFPPEDSEAEAAMLADASLTVIPSIWGHMAASGRSSEDAAFIDATLAAFLASGG